MIVIPAIDLKDGRCVRLKQGRMSDETVFSDVPEEMAVRWYEQGAERLHLVDLNGAVQGKPVNMAAIKRIVSSIPIPVELGGGIRDMPTLEAYMDLGLQFIILGTAAHKNPEFASQACEAFPGRIIIGIDARGDRVAVEGWTEEVDLTPVELAGRFEEAGAAAVVYTDIRRDGMRTGPNVAATERLAKAIRVPVIASGGISDLSDVERIASLGPAGVMGMITGRALYDGSLDLARAVDLCKRLNASSN
ncbi:MAG: 1-(5-phosphoribosyl)-5-[(5-phosphoribosylamino)methylideneamino]imidazole-4-carboxamide isomerase [Deltaproteobacteria bacterium]|nr:1-(5-phosphoribosyl)-5-[(5-phosphoribosylamino)methylideneamino]imidazole-4-carboxamide isomerase [Deltaproteobacteria bacterium]